MRSAFLESFSLFGRRRPSVRDLLADIRKRLMSLEQTINTIASDVKLNATVTMQTAALAAASAASLAALGDVVTKLAADQGIDTTTADATLAGVGEHLSALLATTAQTGAALPGTEAAPVAGVEDGSAAAVETAPEPKPAA